VNSRLLGCRTSVGRHPSHISRPITYVWLYVCSFMYGFIRPRSVVQAVLCMCSVGRWASRSPADLRHIERGTWHESAFVTREFPPFGEAVPQTLVTSRTVQNRSICMSGVTLRQRPPGRWPYPQGAKSAA
jgi:hypothetical protein